MTKTFPNVTNVTSYVWGNDLSGTPQGAGGVGGLLAVISPLLKGGGGGADGGLFYPCYDANGNITEYVDTNGVVVAHYEYDAFGNLTPNSSFLTPNSPDFRFRFSTKYLDVETGLYDYIKRPYSPPLQRFISRDPIGERGGLNLYGFCGNDPINKWDYLGMFDDGSPKLSNKEKYYKVIAKNARYKPWLFSGASELLPIRNGDVIYRKRKGCIRLEQIEYTIVPVGGRDAFSRANPEDPYWPGTGEQEAPINGIGEWQWKMRYYIVVSFYPDGGDLPVGKSIWLNFMRGMGDVGISDTATYWLLDKPELKNLTVTISVQIVTDERTGMEGITNDANRYQFETDIYTIK